MLKVYFARDIESKSLFLENIVLLEIFSLLTLLLPLFQCKPVFESTFKILLRSPSVSPTYFFSFFATYDLQRWRYINIQMNNLFETSDSHFPCTYAWKLEEPTHEANNTCIKRKWLTIGIANSLSPLVLFRFLCISERWYDTRRL